MTYFFLTYRNLIYLMDINFRCYVLLFHFSTFFKGLYIYMYTYPECSLFIFGFVGSWLLRGLFSHCRQWGLLPRCGAQAPHCRVFSCGECTLGSGASGAVVLGSVSAVSGLWSTGSIAQAWFCSLACEIITDQG